MRNRAPVSRRPPTFFFPHFFLTIHIDMSQPSVIVAGYAPETQSETFIRRQVEGLPGVIGTIRKSDLYLPRPTLATLPLYPAQLFRGFRNRSAAIERCVEARPDVVLCQYGPVGAIMAPRLREAEIPFVVHFHGYDAYRHKTLRRFKHSYKRMFASAAAIVSVSNHMTKQLVSLGAPKEKVRCNPYGVEIGVCHADPANAPPRFLFVGRLVPKKAPDLLIRSFAIAAASNPSIELTMIGDGPLRGLCERLVDELGRRQQVRLLGSQPHDVVLEEMSRSRAYVQHSVCAKDGDCEGTPNSILEAAAAGLPIIATKHAGIVDAVRHGETGYLVDEHDVQAMAFHVIEVSGHPKDAGELGSRSRSHIAIDYEMRTSLSRLSEALLSSSRRDENA